MSAYLLTVQKPYGPRANPRNHTRKVIVQANSSYEAETLYKASLDIYRDCAIIEIKDLPAVYCVSA